MSLKAVATVLPEVLILEPHVFEDERGYFFESFNQHAFRTATGSQTTFVQDNHSRSAYGVLRGIHYQIRRPQGKLVRVVTGTVLDVSVDLRRSSPRFGRWTSVELSAENRRQVWIPPGFGHAFLVLSAYADFLYKTTEYWIPELDRGVAWNDPDIGIAWPLSGRPSLSAKDATAPALRAAEVFD